MDDLNDDSENVQNIIDHLEGADVKNVNPISVGGEAVNIKCLWSEGDGQLSLEVLQDGIKVKTPDEDPSLGGREISENSSDHILNNAHELHVNQLKQEAESDENSILTAGEIAEGHILQVHENVGTILSDSPGNMPVSTSLAGDLTSQAAQDVIQLLLPASDQNAGHCSTGLPPINLDTNTGDLGTPPTQTIQAITLSDGNTAFIQHPGGSKFLEGQTITLDDGTTAVIQAIPDKLNLMTSVQNQNMVRTDGSNSAAVHLEDTAFLNQAVKDGLQAIILEDGTTAYLATQQTPGGTGGLIDSAQLEATTLTLDQLTSPAVSGVQTVLTNGLVNVDPKPLTSTTAESEVTTVHGCDSKGAVALPTYTTDKVGPFLEKAYRCGFEECGKYYTTLHHLRVHERSHTGDRPFKCEYENCGKAFATGYGLKSHTRVHTGEKPYKCHEEGCDKAFKTSGDLQKHIRTHTGERPFKCPFEGCTRSFTTSNIRKVHIRTHTGERPYLCPQEGCGRAFASATNYKNHVRIHTGEKPYVCTVMGCGKRFTEYSSLYKHHVVHTHAKPYTCSRCGKTYRQTSTLAMHKRTTHGEDVTAESEALLYQEQAQGEGLEPPGKRMRLGLVNQDDLTEDGEGALVINAPDATQQLAFVGSEGLTTGVDILQSPLHSQTTLLQQAGVAFTLSDQGQQVFVITDPAQLEALQQIAKHQLESDSDPQSLLTTTLTSDDINTAQNTDNIVTMVTEITTESEAKNNPIVTVTSGDVTDIGNE
ncbi:zinc finger protein 76-like isoform X2 [Mercenaria mercenaria]|uniref:zinc finger protein 76-like isoform X2 n=1 Tax=Mercenaria mercenaria TaxID=6596 RepID=UPI001E1DE381|nr:zinc finger protein 76-like isoform X2 [Mercenaria mercenaria]